MVAEIEEHPAGGSTEAGMSKQAYLWPMSLHCSHILHHSKCQSPSVDQGIHTGAFTTVVSIHSDTQVCRWRGLMVTQGMNDATLNKTRRDCTSPIYWSGTAGWDTGAFPSQHIAHVLSVSHFSPH